MTEIAAYGSASAARRGQAYGFLAAVLEYPEGELTGLIRDGTVAQRAREILCAAFPDMEDAIDWDALKNAGNDDDLPTEYTRLFNLPGPGRGPLCPLNSRVYGSEGPLMLDRKSTRLNSSHRL